MAGKIERMDADHEKIIREETIELIRFLDERIAPSKNYTHINMCLNVLTGAVVTIAHNFVCEEEEELFIENMTSTFRANFDANRENKKRLKK